MVEARNYDEAMRILLEAEHNPAGERLIHLAHVRATLAVAEELHTLRQAVTRLTETMACTAGCAEETDATGGEPGDADVAAAAPNTSPAAEAETTIVATGAQQPNVVPAASTDGGSRRVR